MNPIDKILDRYFILALPVLGIFFVLGIIYGNNFLGEGQGIIKYLKSSLGWVLIIWILASFYLFIKMILSSHLRENALKRFIKVKDADERESIISGEAAKVSMISTFALMTLLIFLSTITIKVGEIPGENLEDNKGRYISIGLDPFIVNKKQKVLLDEKQEIIYSGLPIPTSLVLLLVLSWQLTSFHLITKKRLRE